MNKTLRSFYGPIEGEIPTNIIETAISQSKRVIILKLI